MGKHFGLSGSTVVARIGWVFCGLILGLVVCTEDAGATNYFISPAGANSSSGVATTSPWQTFDHAMSVMKCGDTLNLMDGVYGDGTSTGKLVISSKGCTNGSELTVRAVNQRQARISDNGSGNALFVTGSSYIVIDGLVLNSADNGSYTSAAGEPARVTNSNHITFRNGLHHNPNRYGNTHLLEMTIVTEVLVEDMEFYNYHRHAVLTKPGTRVTVRRAYCNPRIGGLSGGYANDNGTAGADSCFSFYPCQDCIAENVIADGTTKSLELSELNATGEVTLSGNQILGSIGYKTTGVGACILLTARGSTLQTMPQSNTIKNVVCYSPGSTGIYSRSAKNTQVVNTSVIGAGNSGFLADKNSSPYLGDGSYSVTNTNSLSFSNRLYGFIITPDIQSWTVTHPNAYNNAAGNYLSPTTTDYSPNPPMSKNPLLGTCIAWIPDGSPLKGAGSGGADVGANILYRYVDGVLTSTPLWDSTTGEFPHGAIVAGINDMAGNSLFDVHKRLNVNTNGCSFPASYGGKGDVTAPKVPIGLSFR